MHAIIGESKRKEQTNALVNKSLIFSYVLSLPLSCGGIGDQAIFIANYPTVAQSKVSV